MFAPCFPALERALEHMGPAVGAVRTLFPCSTKSAVDSKEDIGTGTGTALFVSFTQCRGVFHRVRQVLRIVAKVLQWCSVEDERNNVFGRSVKKLSSATTRHA